MRFQITNPTSGDDLGTYDADSIQAAIDAVCRDAGYADHADALARLEFDPADGWTVVAVPEVVEVAEIERDFGLAGTEAVIDHPCHGRLLIVDGCGGEDTLRGGAVRWQHGGAYRLQPGDTLASLRRTAWNAGVTHLEAVLAGYDDTRPPLTWDGRAVAAVAAAAGI